MGNVISNNVNITKMIGYQSLFTQPTHQTPCIILPHQAFNGQEITLSKAVKEKLNLSENMMANNTYYENEEVWLSMFCFAIQNEYTSMDKVENILNMDHNDEQAELIYEVINDVMASLKVSMSDNQKELLTYTENNGVDIAPHLLSYAQNQFSTELTFGRGDNYGSNEEVSLRLDGFFGLSVIAIDCLIDAPAPLKRIGGLLVRTLVYMSTKLLSTEIIEHYNDYNEHSELFSELTTLNKKELFSLFSPEQDAQEIIKYLKASTTIDNEDLEMIIEDWCIDSFCLTLYNQIEIDKHYSYLTYSQRLEYKPADAIERLSEDFIAIDNSNNPIVAHPLYNHFKHIFNILKAKYIPLTGSISDIISSGSDLPIEEHYVISLNTNLDNEALEIHNENVSNQDEIGSILLDMNNDDLLPFLNNHTLSTILLLGFDA